MRWSLQGECCSLALSLWSGCGQLSDVKVELLAGEDDLTDEAVQDTNRGQDNPVRRMDYAGTPAYRGGRSANQISNVMISGPAASTVMLSVARAASEIISPVSSRVTG